VRTQELKAAIANYTENLEIGVFEGNKILEVKDVSINKGHTANLWLTRKDWNFIFAAGDDYTDEDMFSALPAKAYSIKVRPGISKARFNVDSETELREILAQLVKE
jgi:trehalose 6-phosphate synthase/phosphatase